MSGTRTTKTQTQIQEHKPINKKFKKKKSCRGKFFYQNQKSVNAKTLPISKANLDWRCSEDKLDEEISALDSLDLDNLEVLKERRLQQMKKMAKKRSRWISLGYGEYTEIFSEKDFFSTTRSKAR